MKGKGEQGNGKARQGKAQSALKSKTPETEAESGRCHSPVDNEFHGSWGYWEAQFQPPLFLRKKRGKDLTQQSSHLQNTGTSTQQGVTTGEGGRGTQKHSGRMFLNSETRQGGGLTTMLSVWEAEAPTSGK